MPRLPTIGSARGRLVAVPGLLVVAVALSVLVRAGIVHAATVEVHGPIHGDWPKLITAPFVHRNITYGFIVLALFAIFGSKVEHRSGGGPIVVLLTWLIAGAGGAWLSAETTVSPAAGALAPAMAVTFACGMAALDARRGGDDVDLAGVGVSLVVLALLPALVLDATWQALGVGVVIGTGLGSALTWLDRREANA